MEAIQMWIATLLNAQVELCRWFVCSCYLIPLAVQPSGKEAREAAAATASASSIGTFLLSWQFAYRLRRMKSAVNRSPRAGPSSTPALPPPPLAGLAGVVANESKGIVLLLSRL